MCRPDGSRFSSTGARGICAKRGPIAMRRRAMAAFSNIPRFDKA